MQRLVLMIAGLLVICSCSLAWINGLAPINIGLGKLLSTTIHSLSNGSVLFDIKFLDDISMMSVTFAVGVVIMIAVALGSKAVSLLGLLLTLAVIALWLIGSGLNFSDIITSFNALGIGTQLALISIILILIALILPKVKLPHKPAPAS